MFLGTAFITLYMPIQYTVKREILSWNEEYKTKGEKSIHVFANEPQ
jgi:hypothetical protein